jgi:hypothetical protein
MDVTSALERPSGNKVLGKNMHKLIVKRMKSSRKKCVLQTPVSYGTGLAKLLIRYYHFSFLASSTKISILKHIENVGNRPIQIHIATISA